MLANFEVPRVVSGLDAGGVLLTARKLPSWPGFLKAFPMTA
jgi:hypothetical protein